MAYIYRDTVNIYDKEAIARAIKTQETQFTVLQGKIQALITDTELDTLRNGGSTMYSRMTNVEATANGVTSEVSALKTDIRDNYSTTESMRSEIQQSAQEITASVSTAISGLDTRVQQAETKVTPTAIISTVASTDGARAMVSAINQTASTVQISAAHINLVGAVTADDIAAGAITAGKIASGAVTTDKLDAGAVTAAKIAGGTITGDKIAGGTITGSNIQAGSLSAAQIDVSSIFAQNVTATGTITGAHLVGANCEIEEGSIGGWTLVNGQLISNDIRRFPLTGTSLFDTQLKANTVYQAVYGETDPWLKNAVDLNTAGRTDHEGRISDLEDTISSDITCNTLWANTSISTGEISCTSLSGSNLEATNNITCVHTITCNTLRASGSIHADGNLWASYNSGSGTTAIWSGGELRGQSSSSRRYKDHVSSVTLEEALKVLDIPVINFRYKDGYLADGDEMEGKAIPGFYAEDIEDLVPIAVYHNKDGQVENWQERVILPLMLKVIQEQQHEIDELKRR